MKKLVGLQWGRAAAAIAVVIGHAIAHPFPSAPDFALFLGRAGVTLFFVISGFIMVSTTGPGPFDPKVFISKRLRRIVPLYYFVTVLTAFAALVAPSLFKTTTFDIGHTILSLLFIPAYQPGQNAVIAPVMRLGWTLNYEMFFYVVFASLFWLTALRRAMVLSVLFGVLTLIGYFFEFHNAILTFYTQESLLGFVAGVWVAVAMQRNALRLPADGGPVALAVALVLMLGIAIPFGSLKDDHLAQLALVVLCAAVVAALASGFERWADKPFLAPLTLLGDASYSIYLFHLFAIAAVLRVMEGFMQAPAWLAVIVGSAAGIVAGLVGYFLVERNLARLFGFRAARAKAASVAISPATETSRIG